jgi:predicted GIY-YIG superfamily endonuclease
MNALIAEVRRMALSKGQRPAWKGTAVVYFLRLRSSAIYIGATADIEQRLEDHVSGQACRTTQFDPPSAILRIEIRSTFADARQREAQLKRWSRAKKEALVNGDAASLRSLSRSRDREPRFDGANPPERVSGDGPRSARPRSGSAKPSRSRQGHH